ncbi:MAG: SLC13 family permease [Actinobacteria bacterium]|nr:SLC13 family permease [Actinomycetota bacterium]
MSFEAGLTVAVVVLLVVALVREFLEPDALVFMGLAALMVGGVLTPREALAGFANEGMLTVAALFVVAQAARSSGSLEVLADHIMGRSQGGRRSVLRMMGPVAGVSAFLNNTPIVAMFAPAIRDWALSRDKAPSKFLIPLSYAAIFGGVCTLIGTSTNLLVNGLLNENANVSLGMFTLAWVGVPAALAGMAYMALIGYRILPDRRDPTDEFLASGREYLYEVTVEQGSRFIGMTAPETGLRELRGVYLARVARPSRSGGTYSPVGPGGVLRAGDVLVFAGSAESAAQLREIEGLEICHDAEFCALINARGTAHMIEAVVSRSSPMLGRTVRQGDFRTRYDAAVLAVHRAGRQKDTGLGDLKLRAGDTLLLLTGDEFLARRNQTRDFYMVSKVSEAHTLDRRKATVSLVVLAGMVSLAATGLMDILSAAILATVVLLLTRTVSAVEARRSLELNVLVVIAAALGISKALDKTGVADAVAGQLIGTLEGFGFTALIAAVYATTSLFTEIVTNNAAAAIVFPIALATAAQTGADPIPFAVTVAVAASASFATPIGYQTNLMVYGPGGYRFTDFMKVGIPLNLIFFATTVLVVPAVWGP